MSDARDQLFHRPGAGDRRFVFDRRVVEVFDDMAARSIPAYHETRALFVDLLAAWVPPGGRILDLGTSTGTFVPLVLAARPDLHVVAVDRSEAMIAEARARWGTLDGRVTWRALDAACLDPEPVDAVVALWTLQFVDPERRDALVERLGRALRPGGALLLAEKLAIESDALRDTFERVYHDHKRRQGYSEIEIVEKKRALEGVLRPWTEARWHEALARAGFTAREGLTRWGPFASFVARVEGPVATSNAEAPLPASPALPPDASTSEFPGRPDGGAMQPGTATDDPLVCLHDLRSVLGPDAPADRAAPALDPDVAASLRALVEPGALTVDRRGRVEVGTLRAGVSPDALRETLRTLRPWRKGPFGVAGVEVDAEWDAAAKWERMKGLLAELPSGPVADVGSGNGYYAWRLVAEGRRVVAFEPWALARAQFEAVAHAVEPRLWRGRLALTQRGVETLDDMRGTFGAVLLMGILYHRTDPFATLRTAASALRPGGRMLVETIVVPGDEPVMHIPPRTYAGARGFWGLPTEAAVEAMLRRADLRIEARTDPAPTTPREQRATEWASGRSLADGLDAEAPERTVEGHPAPWRMGWLVSRGAT